MSDTITVEADEYAVEWDGEHVTLQPKHSGGVGRSNPEFTLKRPTSGPCKDEVLVSFADDDNAWAFDSAPEAGHFICVLQGVMDRHLAAAREAGRREAQAKYAALADAARRLVDALPKCTYCVRPATRAWKRGEARFCDGCGPDVPEYPRAQPLRDTIAALAELEKT